MVDKMELRNNFFSTSPARGVLPTMILLFQNSMYSATTTHVLIYSTLNTGETNKIKLTNYFILRMPVFIQNFTNIEEGVKGRGEKFTYPKC